MEWPMPTDRGYAVISSNDDGTQTVKIATGIENGQPVGIYAQHVRASAVRIDPAVRWIRSASHQYTAKVVEVFTGDGAVIIRAPRGSLAS
jgi:hypothetical protein